MQRQFSVLYNLLFSAAVCGVCAIFVSSSAVTLKERQDVNKLLDKKKNVLQAAGLMEAREKISAEEVEQRFSSFRAVVIDLATGEEAPEIDAETFDQQKAKKDPARSREAPPNFSLVKRFPNHALVYEMTDAAGALEAVVVPVEGYGLGSTLLGFLALDKDTRTVRGLAYYDHKETPGLGGEVDNPRWKAMWPGRLAMDESFTPQIEVIKGAAGKPADDPYRVDGLSGATITSRGVTNMMELWLGPDGFGPYLERVRQRVAAGSQVKEAA
ncbi:MAG: Na(+)-translocating NADH-quinone reductase subunit C [bacterium]|nr:Na(+)-translocating NADH-quinone reductase subunit C [bacterium]